MDNIILINNSKNLYQHLVICLIILYFLILTQSTKTVQIIKGITILLFTRTIIDIIGLSISSDFDQINFNIVIILILVLQPEVRQALEHIGRGHFVRKRWSFTNKPDTITSYDKAVQHLSNKKIGALITIEKRVHLDEYIETGIKLDADITGELLINIFTPNTPLHDGAVIIRDGRIYVTCAYLPLSYDSNLSKEYGTRHRAALGISEVTDALTIVISEETGDVSISFEGKLRNHLTREQYLSILTEKLARNTDAKTEKRGVRRIIKLRSVMNFFTICCSGSKFFKQ